MRALTLCLAISACLPVLDSDRLPFRGGLIVVRCPLPIEGCAVAPEVVR